MESRRREKDGCVSTPMQMVLRWCVSRDHKAVQAGHLERHKQLVHNIGVVWHQCDSCDYKTKTAANLKALKVIHNIGVVWHQCDNCDYKAKQASHLKVHKQHIHNIDVVWHQ